MEQSATPIAEVAIVGEDDGLVAAVEAAGGTVVPPEGADAIVVVGEPAFLRVGRSIPRVPVLPVEMGAAHHAVAKPDVESAVATLIDGAGHLVRHPVLGIDVAEERVGRAVVDVTLVTSEPARISEFAVWRGGERLDEFRADAVVVATPVGSDGYAGSAGGPVLTAGTGLVVAPVAPFTTQADTWVVDDAVTLTVARDDEPVDLVLDDGVWGTVDPFEPVAVTVDGWMDLVRVPPAER